MKRQSSADATDYIDDIHRKLWTRSKIRTIYRICILGNFYNLLILSRVEKDFNILRDEFNILFCLSAAGPMTGTDVCRITGRPRNSISRCADKLLKRKLIREVSTPTDKRMTKFEILSAGRKLYRLVLPHFEEVEAQMFAGLSEAERDVLDKVLSKLVGTHSKWDRMF